MALNSRSVTLAEIKKNYGAHQTQEAQLLSYRRKTARQLRMSI